MIAVKKKTYVAVLILLVLVVVFFYQILETGYEIFVPRGYVFEGNSIFQIDPETGNKYPAVTHFEEGFENAERFEDLVTPDRWHLSTVDPKNAGEYGNYYDLGNRITIAKNIVHSGRSSMRAYAKPDKETSKSSIGRNLIYFDKGDDMYISGWFYIDTEDVYDGGGTTFFDVESSWIHSLGIRSIIKNGDALSIELKSFIKDTFKQKKGQEIPFPKNKWVHIETHIYLSDRGGHVEVWQDGVKIIDEKGRTLPLANTVLDKLELGLSAIAKNAKHEKTLYVDDFVISNKPIE